MGKLIRKRNSICYVERDKLLKKNLNIFGSLSKDHLEWVVMDMSSRTFVFTSDSNSECKKWINSHKESQQIKVPLEKESVQTTKAEEKKSGFREPNSQSSDSNIFNQDNNKPGRKVSLSGKWGSRFNNWNETQREILGELASNSQSYDSDTINKKSIKKKIKISDLNDDQKHWLGLVDMRVNSIPFNSIKDIYTTEALGNEHFIEYKKNETEIPETERQEVALSRVKGLLSISDYILRNGSDAQKYHYKSSIKGAILYANYNGINIDELKKDASKYIEEKITINKKSRSKKKEVIKKSKPVLDRLKEYKYLFYIPMTYLSWVIVLSIINPIYPNTNTFQELISMYNYNLALELIMVASFVSAGVIYMFFNIQKQFTQLLFKVFVGWLFATTFTLVTKIPFISDLVIYLLYY